MEEILDMYIFSMNREKNTWPKFYLFNCISYHLLNYFMMYVINILVYCIPSNINVNLRCSPNEYILFQVPLFKQVVWLELYLK